MEVIDTESEATGAGQRIWGNWLNPRRLFNRVPFEGEEGDVALPAPIVCQALVVKYAI